MYMLRVSPTAQSKLPARATAVLKRPSLYLHCDHTAKLWNHDLLLRAAAAPDDPPGVTRAPALELAERSVQSTCSTNEPTARAQPLAKAMSSEKQPHPPGTRNAGQLPACRQESLSQETWLRDQKDGNPSENEAATGSEERAEAPDAGTRVAGLAARRRAGGGGGGRRDTVSSWLPSRC